MKMNDLEKTKENPDPAVSHGFKRVPVGISIGLLLALGFTVYLVIRDLPSKEIIFRSILAFVSFPILGLYIGEFIRSHIGRRKK
jgi:hypothetical protein